jgi:hypothetical protein
MLQKKLMIKIVSCFVVLCTSSFTNAQDTLIIHCKMKNSNLRHLDKWSKTEPIEEIFTIINKDTIALPKVNDSTYFLVHEKESIVNSICIPIWLKSDGKFFITYVYNFFFHENKSVFMELYSKIISFKRRYGFAVTGDNSWGMHSSNGTEKNDKLEYTAPQGSQLKNCLCVP